MASESSAVAAFFRELLHAGVYKRNQGRLARQVTFAVLAVGLGLGAWRLSTELIDFDRSIRYGVPTLVLIVGLWVAFRVVNLPRFADFLIAVEAEMNKVSWPDRPQLIRASMVVMFTIFSMAAILFLYDLLWQMLLGKNGLNILGGG